MVTCHGRVEDEQVEDHEDLHAGNMYVEVRSWLLLLDQGEEPFEE